MLNIALVAGSSRNNSQSGKVARVLRQRLIEIGQTTHDTSSIMDPVSYTHLTLPTKA